MRKLTERDISNLSREFTKAYNGYNEKCGIAKALEIMGYITENTYLLLIDNFCAQEFDKIPVNEYAFRHILERGIR